MGTTEVQFVPQFKWSPLTVKGEPETLRATEVVGETDPKASNVQEDGALNGTLEERVLDLLKREPTITQATLAEKLVVPRRTLQRKIKELQESGRLRRVGGKRYGHWEFEK